MCVSRLNSVKSRTGIVIDVGGTKINCAIVNEQMKITKRWKCRTTELEGDAILEQILQNVVSATKSHEICFTGICIPGMVNRVGTITWMPNIRSSGNIRLKNIVESELKLPTFVTDDRTAAVLGEYLHHHVDNLVVLLIGTGLGAGIMMDGHAFTGTCGGAGAIGWNIERDDVGKHTKIGLVEEIVSGRGIVDLSIKMGLHMKTSLGGRRAVNPEMLTTKQVFDAFDRGDRIAMQAMEKVVLSLSVQITNLVNTLNPSLIILNGTVGLEIARRFLPLIRSVVKANALPYAAQVVQIRESEVGDLSFLYGVAKGAIDLLNARDNPPEPRL